MTNHTSLIGTEDLSIEKRARQLLQFLKEEDLTSLNIVVEERVEFKKRGPGKTPKSKTKGQPPLEFSVAELIIDLETSINNLDFETLRPTYYKLSRLFPY